MFERSDCGHRTCAELMSYRTALHVDDRVVSIFALRRCRQAEDVPRLYLLHHLLKSECRQMVAFINNDLPVFGDEVFDSLSAVGALDDGDIQGATAFAFPASNLAD
jgi:hypothetical protein